MYSRMWDHVPVCYATAMDLMMSFIEWFPGGAVNLSVFLTISGEGGLHGHNSAHAQTRRG